MAITKNVGTTDFIRLTISNWISTNALYIMLTLYLRVLIKNNQAFSLSTLSTQEDYLKVQEVKCWCIFKFWLLGNGNRSVQLRKCINIPEGEAPGKNVSSIMLPRFLLRVNVPTHIEAKNTPFILELLLFIDFLRFCM